MSDLENRAREAARQQQEEQARLQAEQDRVNRLGEEKDRAAKAELHYGDDVTLASYGRKLGEEKARKETASTPPPRRPWYKKGRR